MRLIETEINHLKMSILEMAELVQLQFDYLSSAVNSMDAKLAEKIRKKEQEIDSFDNKIDRRCARIMALYQPVANDLRFVFSVLKINGYLEQIGDLINGISRKTLSLPEPVEESLLAELRMKEMLQQTSEILSHSLNAFFTDNSAQARSVFPLDDMVDEIYKADLDIIARRIEQQPHRAAMLMQLAFNIKNIEKIADLGVAIAEETLFNTEAVIYRHTELKIAHRKQDGDSSMLPQVGIPSYYDLD